MRVDADVDFVTVMSLDRVRHSHPDPARIGERFVGGVGGAIGASRVTVRRYLEHPADSGQAERRPRYGGSGRPEVEYRLV